MSIKSSAAMLCALLAVSFASASAHADGAAQCLINQGTFVTGTVTGAPEFVSSRSKRHGYPLSHTRLNLRKNDGTIIEVDIDNVFALGYSKKRQIPDGLQAITDGTKMELCGQTYSDPGGKNGVHWVHTNCDTKPTPSRPDGWVKIIGRDGSIGENLVGIVDHCDIF